MEAHREADGGVGRCGDGRWAANRRRGSPGTEVEEDVGDDVVVLPRLLGSAWMKKMTVRSSRSHRQVVGWPVAMSTASGGPGCARRCEEEMPEEGDEAEEGGKVRGGRPHLLGVQVDSGKDSQREAGGGVLGRVRGLSLCLLVEVEDDWQVARWDGPATWAPGGLHR